MGKRADGEGSIHKFSRKRKDGTLWEGWQGSISLGYKASGKRDRRAVYGASQAEVKAKLELLKRQVADGVLTDTKLMVKAYLEQWLTYKEGQVKPRTAEIYKHLVDYHLIPRIGRKRLDKLTALDVQGMVADIAKLSGTRTANMCRSALYNALKQAIRWQLLARNPVEAVDPLKDTPREMVLWAPAEVAHFLDVARPHKLYALFYLALSTGMRRGELLGLRWQDVKGSVVSIRQNLVMIGNEITISTPKTKKGQRRVSISPDMLEVFSLHRQQQDIERGRIGNAWQDHDLVFAGEYGQPMYPRNLERAWYGLQAKARDDWKEAAAKAGDIKTLDRLEAGKIMPRIRMHDLRHLHVSFLVKNGVDAATIADRVGHTRASFTLDVYTHLFDEQRTAAAVSILDMLPKGNPATAN